MKFKMTCLLFGIVANFGATAMTFEEEVIITDLDRHNYKESREFCTLLCTSKNIDKPDEIKEMYSDFRCKLRVLDSNKLRCAIIGIRQI